MHERAKTVSQQVKESIADDSRFGIGDDAFRTAPPIGGLSCFFSFSRFQARLITRSNYCSLLVNG